MFAPLSMIFSRISIRKRVSMNIPGDVKQVYQEGYAKQCHLAGNQRLRKVLNIMGDLKLPAPSKLLDVGCGDGGFTQLMDQTLHAKALYGLDISKEAVKLAVKNGINAQCLDVDEGFFPYDDRCFDFIYCGHLLELVLNPDHLVKEMKRVLSSQGIMIITHPNLGAWASRLAIAMGRLPFYSRVSTEVELGKFLTPPRPGNSTGFIRLFTTHAFRHFLKFHGLEGKKVFGIGEEAIPSILLPLDFVLSRFPSLAFHNIWIVSRV